MSRGAEGQRGRGAEGQRGKGDSRLRALVGFAGFGGPEIALREVGIETVGIENDYAIAEVNRFNGGNVIRADILDIDPEDYAGWILYHFSPPCPSFSLARNSKALITLRFRISDLARHQRLVNGETEQDIALARKICDFIRLGRPEYFTLENVWGYRKSLSWHLIQYTLLEEGYGMDAWNLNAADYGVPQSRKRMIVIARRDGRQPAKPWPTHSKKPDMFTQPWCGWYEAIEDLIPQLPESRLANWQLDRKPEELKTHLVMTGNTNRNGIDNKPGRGYLGVDQPANTVNTVGNGSLPRAIIIPGDNTSNKTIRYDDEPMVTVQTRTPTRCPHRAFIIQSVNGYRMAQNRTDSHPIWTITTTGRIVSMTVRALARFQDFLDSFVLPGEPGLDENIVLLLDSRTDRELACQGIGNALPAGLYRAVLKSVGIGGAV